MKKIILPALWFLVTFSLFGQTKITKASIVGKWVISAVEMKGMFYYSVENDSLGFGDMIKAQVADTSQLKAVPSRLKIKAILVNTVNCGFIIPVTAFN